MERGIYRQSNGKYAVCVMVDGRPRFRTLEASRLDEVRTQREQLALLAQLGELPVSPRLTFAEVSARWLADFETRVGRGERRARTLDYYRSNLRLSPAAPLRSTPPRAHHPLTISRN
jgi:hypothetical protein